MLGVVHVAPELLVPTAVPLVEALNHSILPALAVAEIPTTPEPHLAPPDDAVTVGAVHAVKVKITKPCRPLPPEAEVLAVLPPPPPPP